MVLKYPVTSQHSLNVSCMMCVIIFTGNGCVRSYLQVMAVCDNIYRQWLCVIIFTGNGCVRSYLQGMVVCDHISR
jgi:hypothetical protein